MVPHKMPQPPRPLAPLRKGRLIKWVRITPIPLDANGNDAGGLYWGRGGMLGQLWRIDYPDATWAATFSQLDKLQLKLKRLHPLAKVEYGVALPLPKGPHWDYAKDQAVNFSETAK